MSNYYSVKNWDEFQHYKDRNPPWIKLHTRLLADYEFACLQDASKAHLMLIWLLASQLGNKIPADEKWIKEKIGAKEKINIKELVDNGFLILEQTASNALAKCSPETETDNKKNIKKKNSRQSKISLAEFETKNGEILPEQLGDFQEKNKLTKEQMAELVSAFRSKCQASDYRYVNFHRAFESWDWAETIKRMKTTGGGWQNKPGNRMPSPAGG